MALTLTFTPAGLAALVNAKGDGTNAVNVALIGLAGAPFDSGQPVASEVKRVATISGGNTAKDTIHVTVTDAGTDVYTVYGFGLYLADGTLLGSYGQAAPILQKSALSTMLLSADVQFAQLDGVQLLFGDTNFANPAATTDTLGVVKLASEQEATAGTDAQKAVTAKGLLAALNARLGNLAPTTFVKTLLAKASVLEFVTALGIRGAAQYDPGAGNGLDADKLDGKEGSYYQAALGYTPVQQGGGVGQTGNKLQLGWSDAARLKLSVDGVDCGNISIDGHHHAVTDVDGLADALAAKQDKLGFVPVQQGTGVGQTKNVVKIGWSTGSRLKATVDGTDLGNFSFDGHHHAITEVDGLADALAAKQDKLGFVPVQQGGGPGQSTNKLQIGWGGTSAIVKIAVDGTDLGGIALLSGAAFNGPVSATALRSQRVFANGTWTDDGQGSTLTWNDDNGSGQTYLTNQRGGGAGGLVIRSIKVVNGSVTENRSLLDWRPGSGVQFQDLIKADAGMTVSGQTPWHTGNFDPGTKQATLGFTPVQQAGGANQTGNKVAIGWSADGLRASVDGTDLGPFAFRSQAPATFAQNGWAQMIGGLIMQWGVYVPSGVLSEGTGPTITFPRSFPNTCLSVALTERCDTAAVGADSIDDYAQVTGITPSYFGTFIQLPASGRNNWRGAYWLAVGY